MTETSAAHAIYCNAALLRRIQLNMTATHNSLLDGDLKATTTEAVDLLDEALAHLDTALNCCARAHLIELLAGGVE